MKKMNKQTKRKLIIFGIKTIIYIVVGLVIWHISAAKHRQTEKDIGENLIADEIEEGVEDAIEIAEITPTRDFYLPQCKLTPDLQKAVFTACNSTGIPYSVGLALIEVESGFNPYAVNATSGCYGLCQLHPKYFPTNLTPAENIETGIKHLARLYGNNGGDIEKALTIYNAGHDNGTRAYANKVMQAAHEWEEIFCNEF